jgi:hypothetical protein
MSDFPGVQRIRDGIATRLGRFVTLPGASAAHRGSIGWVYGGAGVADRLVFGGKNTSDAVAWEDLGQAALDGRYVNVTGDTMTGSLTISSTLPEFRLYDSDAASDEKYWRLRADAGIFKLDTVNDAFSSSTAAMTFNRSGQTPTAPTISGLAGTGTRVVEASSVGLLSAGSNLGLVHLNTTSFSAVTAVSVNDVFSATHDNYRIILQIDAHATSNAGTLFRFRVGGADDAGAAEYNYALQSNNNAPAAGTAGGVGGTTFILICNPVVGGTTTDLFGVYDIGQPFNSSARSALVGQTTALRSGVDWVMQSMGGFRGSDKSHTGFSIVSGSGNIAGVVRTYGLRNS